MIIHYLKQHEYKEIDYEKCRKKRDVKSCSKCLRYEECFPKKKKG